MLKKYVKSSFIIGLIKQTGLAILLVWMTLSMASVLFNHAFIFQRASHFFSNFKWVFLGLHGAFYVALFYLWPKLVLLFAQNKGESLCFIQIKRATQARWYLIGAFVMFELLHGLR